MSRAFLFGAAMAAVHLGAAVKAQAQSQRAWMQDLQIHAELTARKLAGVYPGGLVWSEIVNQDGSSDYEEPGARRPGRWSIKGELFCFAYALPSNGGCFRVVKHSANCYELYTASIGGIAPATPPPAANMSWNGRMWRDTERATCDEKITS